MNGFIARAAAGKRVHQAQRPGLHDRGATDVMGYHDGGEIPNYWAYAKNFVLQDHMFEPNLSWSLPQHLFMVSGVVGLLPDRGRPDELHQRARKPGHAAGLQQSRARSPTTPGPT